MKVTELRDALRAEPFVPFKLRMVSGEKISVKHPELVAISPSGRTAVAFIDREDRMERFDIGFVEAIEYTKKSGGGSNGRRKKAS